MKGGGVNFLKGYHRKGQIFNFSKMKPYSELPGTFRAVAKGPPGPFGANSETHSKPATGLKIPTDYKREGMP